MQNLAEFLLDDPLAQGELILQIEAKNPRFQSLDKCFVAFPAFRANRVHDVGVYLFTAWRGFGRNLCRQIGDLGVCLLGVGIFFQRGRRSYSKWQRNRPGRFSRWLRPALGVGSSFDVGKFPTSLALLPYCRDGLVVDLGDLRRCAIRPLRLRL